MGEVVEFPDVEVALVAHLKARLSARGIAAKVATQRKANDTFMVRVQRLGGTRDNRVSDRPMVTFECWAATDSAAADLSRVVRGEVQALDNTPVGSAFLSHYAEVGGPAYFPHPETQLSRYQHTQQFDVVGVITQEVSP